MGVSACLRVCVSAWCAGDADKIDPARHRSGQSGWYKARKQYALRVVRPFLAQARSLEVQQQQQQQRSWRGKQMEVRGADGNRGIQLESQEDKSKNL